MLDVGVDLPSELPVCCWYCGFRQKKCGPWLLLLAGRILYDVGLNGWTWAGFTPPPFVVKKLDEPTKFLLLLSPSSLESKSK